jgi:peptidoglycan/LPS O-acetylase OafA/YrhL
MNYRREIDGLRALAVVPVILFHAGVQTFSGGFVGVDVFFVISGYLITSIIIAQIDIGEFSLIDFYERRARRILPALFLVMFVCLPFAWLWLLPAEMMSFSQSLIAVSSFVSNILFWRTSGYFETAAELKPLLHTWSLAAEEQYYLLFPFFLTLTWKLGKRWIISLLVVAAFISLMAAQWGSINKPAATFFLLPTRGFELFIGAFVAFYLYYYAEVIDKFGMGNPVSQAVRQSGSLVGLLLIVYAIFVFDKQTPFPSLYTLAPTIGTALLILFATPKTHVGKLLSSRLLVGVGLISYSAYLWHQPLFAFARHASFGELGKSLLTLLFAASFVCAYFSWKYIEKPFRNNQQFNRKTIFTYSVLGSVFFIIVGLTGLFSKGFVFRFSEDQRNILSYSQYDVLVPWQRYKCFLEAENTYLDFSTECQDTTKNSNNTILLWGDSYAAALSTGLRVSDSNVIQYTTSRCPPVLDIIFTDVRNCVEINNFILREVERLQPTQVFLHAAWQSYNQNTVLNVEKTIRNIKEVSPTTHIVVVGSVPQWKPTLPIYAIRRGISLNKEHYLLMQRYKSIANVDKNLIKLSTMNGVTFLSALKDLCVNDNCLAVVWHEKAYELTAFDSGHLTEAGSIFLAKKLLEKLNSDY